MTEVMAKAASALSLLKALGHFFLKDVIKIYKRIKSDSKDNPNTKVTKDFYLVSKTKQVFKKYYRRLK